MHIAILTLMTVTRRSTHDPPLALAQRHVPHRREGTARFLGLLQLVLLLATSRLLECSVLNVGRHVLGPLTTQVGGDLDILGSSRRHSHNRHGAGRPRGLEHSQHLIRLMLSKVQEAVAMTLGLPLLLNMIQNGGCDALQAAEVDKAVGEGVETRLQADVSRRNNLFAVTMAARATRLGQFQRVLVWLAIGQAIG